MPSDIAGDFVEVNGIPTRFKDLDGIVAWLRTAG